MSIFGHDYKGRKNIPIYFFLTRYFPKALVEVTKVCVAGNAQHNPELALTDINWSRGKSTDQLNTAIRHLMDHAIDGPFDQEPPEVLAAIGDEQPGTYHLAKAAWRVLAALELEIERQEANRTAGPDHGDGPVTEGFLPGFEQRCAAPQEVLPFSPESQGQSAEERLNALGEWVSATPVETVNEAIDRISELI